jgi:protein involved in polysaccharide export with SLBB domain
MSVNLRSLIIVFTLLVFTTNHLVAQDIPADATVESVESLSDKKLFGYYEQIKAQGYSDEQIRALARARGVSAEKITEFESRILALNTSIDETEEEETFENELEIDAEELISKNGSLESKPKSEIFGMDFFSNQNISFSPNLNLSTPINYKLGPGDKLVISIWGASEKTYSTSIDREGALRLPNIGPVLLNGLTIEAATSKIKGALKRIYNGLDAPENSPSRVNIGVSLASVRTVQINIIGEVDTPGTYSLSSLSTVLNALYAAGGPSDKGTFRDIKLVRNGEETVSFDMYTYLTKGSQEGNLVLRDQDIILVSPYLSRVSIYGAVKRPGLFELKPNETLKDLLKFTSGFTSMAYKDLVIVERISGDAKRILEVDMSKATSEILKDGDYINIQSILGGFENKVEIEGAVSRPGIFELTEGLTVSQLIKKADNVLDRAFLERGIILRSFDGVGSEVISFSIADIAGDKAKDILLENNDLIKIYNKYKLKEMSYVTISGAVIKPKRIRFVDNLTVEDLVLLSGGFTENADISKIDVYRKIVGEKEDKLVETLRIESLGIKKNNTNAFLLKPNDRISVRYLKGYADLISVSISGEVNYPGDYSLETKEERISDLVKKAGGLSRFAYEGGASLTRVNPYYKEKAQAEVIDDVKENISEDDEDISLKNKQSLRVGIDLVKIMKNPGSKFDMILRSGDEITVPSTKQTVKVDGEVLVPSLVRYDESYGLKDYISNSGGFSENARKGKTYVVYLNGEIQSTKRFLFFRSFPKLEPGALIIVPNKPKRENNISTQGVIGIVSGVATIIFLLDNVLKN